MRGFLILILSSLIGCAVPTESVQPLAPPAAEKSEIRSGQAEPAPALKVEQREFPLAIQNQTAPAKVKLVSVLLGGIDVKGVSFDARTHFLKVVDQKGGPGSEFATAADANRSVSGLAAINAGFFTPEGAPLGFVYTDGNRRGSLNRSSLGSGVYVQKGRRLSLVRREAFANDGVQEALQTGPFLVRGKTAVRGLKNELQRPRSVLITDGADRWAMIQTGPVTLAGLGKALAGQSFDGWPIETALNLDGGRSCDLYVSSSISGGPQIYRAFFAKPVRNFLVLVSRN